jgi:predicted DCC family thiol-disulfide oxidoreductase YuxK
VLDRFPGLDERDCDREVKLVRADGQIFSGAEAVVQAVRRRPLGFLLRAYYFPGLKQACNRLYRTVARRRARLG